MPDKSIAPSFAPKGKTKPTGQYCLLLLVGLLLDFVVGRIVPPFAGITQVGIQVIFIFIGTLYFISAGFGLIVASGIGMIALVCTDYTDPAGIIASTFGTASLIQLLFVYVLCGAIRKTGAGAVMARWMLTRKFINGRPVVFSIVFFEAVALFACLCGASGAVLFFFTIVDSLCAALDYDDRSQFKKVMITGVYIAAALGSPTLPFKGTGLMIFGLVVKGLETAGIAVNYASYIGACLGNQLLFALLLGVLLKPVFRCDISKLKGADIISIMSDGPTKMNREQGWCFWGFIAANMYSILLLLPFVKSWSFFPQFKMIGQCFVFLGMIMVLSIVRVDKKPVIVPGQMFKESIMWDVIFPYCVFVSLGSALASTGENGLGIREAISTALAPAFGDMHYLVFALILITATYVITNFFSNTATGLIMAAIAAPYIADYAATIGTNPNMLGASICVACSVAYLTPGAGNVSAVYHGQACIDSDKKWVWTWGLAMGVLFIVVAWFVFGLLSFI